MQSLQEESERCTTNANKIDQKMNEIYIPWICKLFDFCAGMFLFNRINITSRSSLSLPKTSTSFPATASLASRCGARQWKRWKTAPTARSSVTTHASPSFDASRFYGDRTEISWASLQQSSNTYKSVRSDRFPITFARMKTALEVWSPYGKAVVIKSESSITELSLKHDHVLF